MSSDAFKQFKKVYFISVNDDHGVGQAGGPTLVQKSLLNAGGPSGCQKCGQVGHKSRNCDEVGVGGSCVCYYCGESGHITYECSKGCYECRETGHMAKDCPHDGCFLCDQDGHWATDCPRPSLWEPSDDNDSQKNQKLQVNETKLF
jgi:hypothetical protein